MFNFILQKSSIKKVKDKSKLVPVVMQVNRKGKIHHQVFWKTPEEAKELLQKKKSKEFDFEVFRVLRNEGTPEARQEALKYLKKYGIKWEESSNWLANLNRAEKAAKKHKSKNKLSVIKPKEKLVIANRDTKQEVNKLFDKLLESMGKEKLKEYMKSKGVTWSEQLAETGQWMQFVKATKKYLAGRLDDITPPVVQDTPPVVQDTPPVVQDTDIIVKNNFTYSINPELIKAYESDSQNPEITLAYHTAKFGTSGGEFSEKLRKAYAIIKTPKSLRSLNDKEVLENTFGTEDPSKQLVNLYYRARDILNKWDYIRTNENGRVIVNDIDFKKEKNNKNEICWAVMDNLKSASYQIKDSIKKLGGRWDKDNSFWYFDGREQEQKIFSIVEALKYGENVEKIKKEVLENAQASDNGVDQSSQFDGRNFTGLVSRIPLQHIQNGEYGRIIPTRARKLTGDGEFNSFISKSLMKHQVDGVNLAISAVENYGGFLLSDGTGAGKTVQELAVSQHYSEKGETVLIVVPNSGVMETAFGEDAVMLGIHDNVAALTNDNKVKSINRQNSDSNGYFQIQKGKINLITYNNIDKISEFPDYTIFDEAHFLKNSGSSRSKQGKNLANRSKGVIYATATPMDKGGHIHYLEKLGIFKNTSFSSIMTKLGYTYEANRFGGAWKRSVRLSEAINRLEAFFSELEDLGLMLKREVAMDKVEVSFNTVEIPQEAEEQMNKLEAIYGDNPAIMLMAQRRYQEPYKIPHIQKMALEELQEGRQVVIFADRVNNSEIKNQTTGRVSASSEGTIKTLSSWFEKQGIPVSHIYGNSDVSMEKEKFQNGITKVAIVTPEKGGAGLSLDDDTGTAPRSMLVMTPPFSAVNVVQMSGRINRLNTQSISRIKFLFGDTPVEEWNRGIISEKMNVLHAAVQGDVKKLKI